ncbi:ORF104R [Turbot reddish body iridovirus]|nr:ORF104R [Turbot reddish body iridovirus]
MVLMSVLSKCVVILRKLNGMVISSSLSKNASVGVYSLLYGGSITLLNTSPPPHPTPLPAAQSAASRLTKPM